MARPKTNNNPFALMQMKPSQWQGLVSAAPDGFLKFSSPYYGARAGFINFVNTYLKKGLNTIEKIFPVYAPLGHGANDPVVYINRVAQLTGIPKNKALTDSTDIYKVAKAIVTHEEGNFWLSSVDFDTAFKNAMEQVKFDSIIKTSKTVGGGLAIILLLIFLIYYTL